MQRNFRLHDHHLLVLFEKAIHDNGMRGYLCKRTADASKWQLRWFVLYQNLLFYLESEYSTRPPGVIFLEGSYCNRIISRTTGKVSTGSQHCFLISYRKEGSRQYELKAETESECNAWIQSIENASFSKTMLKKEELEQKHLHLVQIVENEKTCKWQYTQQCEELTLEIKKLRAELYALKKAWHLTPNRSEDEPESDEIAKIKKVQSFFRGWLCRKRWKQIVVEYINSPHAESMRKRNSLVFRMVESEEEYLEQLQMLVTYFLRPFKMSASSQKPPCSHDEVSSIFLNSETVMFLHQIFLKGLTSRMESWPTLVLGDLFDMLLPMLTIYQEYVRNHHYSIQVLAECKQRKKFNAMLRRLEEKPVLQGRTLEAFLTYPMHQVPRYIITLHELLAHTPHSHVERKSLEIARAKLEELSRQMHDEVSETENIRKNLAIERMIAGGCDILLDVNQVFIRQGSVIRVVGGDKSRLQRTRVRESVQQCFLFTNHILLCTRTSSGKLYFAETYTTGQKFGRTKCCTEELMGVGKVSLADATLVEDPNEQFQFSVEDGESSVSSASSQSNGLSETSSMATSSGSGVQKDYGGLDFKIVVDNKNGPPVVIHLVAPTSQEKAAWTSDISQCIDNVHFNDLFHSTMSEFSSVTMPHFIRNDPRLFKDDVDIRFSRTLNSCKVPQIRYASPERLFERLTDLRFLSIDFLNTFLLTYRVFTDAVTVLKALKKVHYNPELQMNTSLQDSTGSLEAIPGRSLEAIPTELGGMYVNYEYSRRISTESGASDLSEPRDREQSLSTSDALLNIYQTQPLQAFRNQQHWRLSHRKFEEEQKEQSLKRIRDTPTISPGIVPLTIPVFQPSTPDFLAQAVQCDVDNGSEESEDEKEVENSLLAIPGSSVQSSHSCDTLTPDGTETNGPNTPTNLSSTTSTATLVGSAWSSESPRTSPIRKSAPLDLPEQTILPRASEDTSSQALLQSTSSSPSSNLTARSQTIKDRQVPPRVQSSQSSPNVITYLRVRGAVGKRSSCETESGSPSTTPRSSFQTDSTILSTPRTSFQTDSTILSTPRSSFQTESTILSTPRSSFQYPDSPQHSSKAGVVVTSSRASTRRSSKSSAAAAFAAATAGSSNPPEPLSQSQSRAGSNLPSAVGADLKIPNAKTKRESMISTAATMRVLNVLRHWVSKHSQDFENDPKLLHLTTEFLEELTHNTNLLPAEHKAAAHILQMITKQDQHVAAKLDLDVLLAPPTTPSKETVEELSALELAEEMTYLDHQIFVSIRSEEFLGQAWMKADKTFKAPNIILMTRRFNHMNRLVVSEIMGAPEMSRRVCIIEKWATVADICRCLHNFNGVLQIISAFMNSSVFRLKKTWEKVSKTSKQTIDKLQILVAADGRFRNMRDALHRCDPPCIPYLGLYLTDLTFIEEGTPNFTEEGLLNFSKMRMIAHVIREIRHFQQTPYKIETNPKVTDYLLNDKRLMQDDELYQLSLCLEPRLSSKIVHPPSTSAFGSPRS